MRSRSARDGDPGLDARIAGFDGRSQGRNRIARLHGELDAASLPGRVHVGKHVLLDALRGTCKGSVEALQRRRDSGAEGAERWMQVNSVAGRLAGMARGIARGCREALQEHVGEELEELSGVLGKSGGVVARGAGRVAERVWNGGGRAAGLAPEAGVHPASRGRE